MLSIRRFCLAILIGAGLFIGSPTSRAVDPRLLPANTEMVLTVNVKQMLASELAKSKGDVVKQIKAALENYPDVTKYLKQLGFDPFTNLTSVTIAHPGNDNLKELFVVIDGAIDAKKLADTAATADKDNPGSVRTSQFGGTTLYQVKVVDNTGFLALVDGKSLALSFNEEVLKGAITRSTGNAIVATKVKDLLKTTSDKQSLSIVTTGEAVARMAKLLGDPNNPIPGADALAMVQGLSGAITMTKEIEFMIGVGSKDATTAKTLELQLNLGLGFLKIAIAAQAAQDPELVPLVDVLKTVRVMSKENNTMVMGTVSPDNLEKLIKSFGKKLQNGGK